MPQPKRWLILLTLPLLTTCAATVSEAPKVDCPPLKTYSKDQEGAALAEIERLPINDPVRMMIVDYHALRNGCRAAGH